MITNRWRCNTCAVVTEVNERETTQPHNPPRFCGYCGQDIYGFRHDGRFSDGRLIVSEIISERVVPPVDK